MRRVELVKSMKATGVLLFARPDDEDSPTFAKTDEKMKRKTGIWGCKITKMRTEGVF